MRRTAPMHAQMDPSFTLQNEPPNIIFNAVTWGIHMGVSSNLRYQSLGGIDAVRSAQCACILGPWRAAGRAVQDAAYGGARRLGVDAWRMLHTTHVGCPFDRGQPWLQLQLASCVCISVLQLPAVCIRTALPHAIHVACRHAGMRHVCKSCPAVSPSPRPHASGVITALD